MVDINTIGLAIIAVAQAVTAYFSYRLHTSAAKNATNSADIAANITMLKTDTKTIKADTKAIQTSTNGMQEKLLAATDKAAFAIGKEEGRQTEVARAETASHSP